MIDLAERECRHPREQARFFIIQCLKDSGLLKDEGDGKDDMQENKI